MGCLLGTHPFQGVDLGGLQHAEELLHHGFVKRPSRQILARWLGVPGLSCLADVLKTVAFVSHLHGVAADTAMHQPRQESCALANGLFACQALGHFLLILRDRRLNLFVLCPTNVSRVNVVYQRLPAFPRLTESPGGAPAWNLPRRLGPPPAIGECSCI